MINFASLAGRYDKPISTRFPLLAPIDCLKVPAQNSEKLVGVRLPTSLFYIERDPHSRMETGERDTIVVSPLPQSCPPSHPRRSSGGHLDKYFIVQAVLSSGGPNRFLWINK